MTLSHTTIAGVLLAALVGATQMVGHAWPQAASGPGRENAGLSRPALAPPAEPGEYRIGPDDILDIWGYLNLDLTRTVQVRPDGKISLPFANDIQAAGLTALQLRDLVVKSLQRALPDQELSVIVREVHSIKVSVMGKVRTPGRYEPKGQITVVEALALAGGFVEFAKQDSICILRRDGTRVLFNYEKVLDARGGQENFLLQPGDIIIVP